MTAEELKNRILKKIEKMKQNLDDEFLMFACLFAEEVVKGVYEELLEKYDKEMTEWAKTMGFLS